MVELVDVVLVDPSRSGAAAGKTAKFVVIGVFTFIVLAGVSIGTGVGLTRGTSKYSFFSQFRSGLHGYTLAGTTGIPTTATTATTLTTTSGKADIVYS